MLEEVLLINAYDLSDIIKEVTIMPKDDNTTNADTFHQIVQTKLRMKHSGKRSMNSIKKEKRNMETERNLLLLKKRWHMRMSAEMQLNTQSQKTSVKGNTILL